MSLQHTESFIAYPQVIGNDEFNTDNTQAILNAAANLRRGGYEVAIGTQDTVALSGGIVVRQDPIAPGRAALVHTSSATPLSTAPKSSAIRKRLPLTRKTLIGGFSLYVPPEFVRSMTSTTVPCLRVFCPVGSSASWHAAYTTGDSANEVFRISADLMFRWGTDAPLSDKTLAPGRMAFIEFTISDTEIRVWVDNVIVLQKSFSLIRESIAFSFDALTTPAGASTMTGVPGRWAISNWYLLQDDGVAPTTRLGPTTRVIGVRPDVDVETDFQRPAGYSSNAAVVAQPLVDAPPVSLQAASVGDQDVYETILDTETMSGSLVHALAVKVMSGSLDGANHTLRPLLRTQLGTEGMTDRTPALKPMTPIPGNAVPVDVAVRHSDGALFAATTTGVYQCLAGDGSTWEKRTDILGTITDILCIASRADGAMVFGRSSGMLAVIQPNSETAVNLTLSGTGAWKSIAVSPEGWIVLVGNNGRFTRSTSPTGNVHLTANWSNGTIISGGDFVGVAVDKTGSFAATTSASPPAVYRSSTFGASWVLVASGASGAAAKGMVSDGDQLYIIGGYIRAGYDTYSRKSSDGGQSWSGLSVPNLNSAVIGANLIQVAYAKGDEFYNKAGTVITTTSNVARLAFIAQNGTTVYTPEPVTNDALTAATALPDGRWLLLGTGVAWGFDAQAIDVNLVAFSGFVPSYSISAINPDTGVAWTPAEAAVAQFGMRVQT